MLGVARAGKRDSLPGIDQGVAESGGREKFGQASRNGIEECDAARLVGKLDAFDQCGAVALREIGGRLRGSQWTFDKTREIETKALKFGELFGGRLVQ